MYHAPNFTEAQRGRTKPAVLLTDLHWPPCLLGETLSAVIHALIRCVSVSPHGNYLKSVPKR